MPNAIDRMYGGDTRPESRALDSTPSEEPRLNLLVNDFTLIADHLEGIARVIGEWLDHTSGAVPERGPENGKVDRPGSPNSRLQAAFFQAQRAKTATERLADHVGRLKAL